MQEEHLSIIWKILSEYISSRDQESAAHHLVNELIDVGAEEDMLYAMCKGNPILRKAIQENLSESEIDDDDYEEL